MIDASVGSFVLLIAGVFTTTVIMALRPSPVPRSIRIKGGRRFAE